MSFYTLTRWQLNLGRQQMQEFLDPGAQEPGDYFIFDSFSTGDPSSTDIIITFNLDGSIKDSFNRLLNACFLTGNTWGMAKPTYQWLKHFMHYHPLLTIKADEGKTAYYEQQLEYQFSKEFNVDLELIRVWDASSSIGYDLLYNRDNLRSSLEKLEYNYPILRAYRRDSQDHCARIPPDLPEYSAPGYHGISQRDWQRELNRIFRPQVEELPGSHHTLRSRPDLETLNPTLQLLG